MAEGVVSIICVLLAVVERLLVGDAIHLWGRSEGSI